MSSNINLDSDFYEDKITVQECEQEAKIFDLQINNDSSSNELVRCTNISFQEDNIRKDLVELTDQYNKLQNQMKILQEDFFKIELGNFFVNKCL